MSGRAADRVPKGDRSRSRHRRAMRRNDRPPRVKRGDVSAALRAGAKRAPPERRDSTGKDDIFGKGKQRQLLGRWTAGLTVQRNLLDPEIHGLEGRGFGKFRFHFPHAAYAFQTDRAWKRHRVKQTSGHRR